MTTHNTREVEALREIIAEKHGGLGLCDYMFENTIVPFLHQELQKARETWLREEIVKLEGMKKDEVKWQKAKYDVKSIDAVIHNRALQNIIDRYKEELNQDNK